MISCRIEVPDTELYEQLRCFLGNQDISPAALTRFMRRLVPRGNTHRSRKRTRMGHHIPVSNVDLIYYWRSDLFIVSPLSTSLTRFDWDRVRMMCDVSELQSPFEV